MQEPDRKRENGMQGTLRFFGLSRDQWREPVSAQATLAIAILAVIGLVVWLATDPSHHPLSVHRVAGVVFGVGLGVTLGAGVNRWRAKRADSS